MTCGAVDAPVKRTNGSILVEAGLIFIAVCCIVFSYTLAALVFLMFLIYGVWRLATKRQVCSGCGAENPIPLDSPVAKRFLGRA
jgi:hypothetical protein